MYLNSKIIKKVVVFILIFISSLFFPGNSFALTTETGNSVIVDDKEVINDNLFVAGQVVKVESGVDGDIYCAGQTVEINANVSGDILCAAQNIVIGGVVDGDIRVLAQNLTLNGEVSRNVTFFGQSVISDAIIDRDFLFGSQLARINGDVRRNILGGAESAFLAANIGNEVSLYVDSLNIESGAKIGGNLTYESENQAVISQKASISGKIVKNTPKVENWDREKQLGRFEQTPQHFLASRFKSLILNLIFVLVLVYLFKNFFQKIAESMRGKIKEFSLTGLLILIIVPIISILVILTIIGIPFGLLGLILYGCALCFARIMSMVTVGVVITDKYFASHKGSLLFASGIGVFVSWIGFSIPILRCFLTLFYIIWGLGALYKTLRPLTSKK
ncbi:hypothetical protein A2159_00565 [Candidatus Woesebacteria bacterium RBG_13_34_9]|uniref:DUF8173 domain-containing protein n=1 Tax=Candidatus Woesebacteria bacterium RBG_13_34_9 TaxID=1802477 RepID=A0A1F7X2K0_9BACT|nr:MAG: hypothetical protein A2159_00565 [Candidatus Woesebacteria bacterium RBG_13_34_9]